MGVRCKSQLLTDWFVRGGTRVLRGSSYLLSSYIEGQMTTEASSRSLGEEGRSGRGMEEGRGRFKRNK